MSFRRSVIRVCRVVRNYQFRFKSINFAIMLMALNNLKGQINNMAADFFVSFKRFEMLS